MSTIENVVDLADENLMLCVVDALRELGLVPRFDRKAWRAAHPADPEDFESELQDLGIAVEDATAEDLDDLRDEQEDLEVRAALVGTPVSREMALAVREILNTVMPDPAKFDVWPQWDGEDDTFTVRSLAGIEAFEGLEKLLLGTDVAIDDLGPVARLSRLQEFELDRDPLPSLRPLLECGALRRVRLSSAASAQEDVLAALRGRGVAVDVRGPAVTTRTR